jgi:hypothetical protein
MCVKTIVDEKQKDRTVFVEKKNIKERWIMLLNHAQIGMEPLWLGLPPTQSATC